MRNGEKRASRWSLSNMCFWKQYLRTMHGEKTPKCQALLLGLNQGRVTPALGLLGSLSSNFHRRDTQTATPPTRRPSVLSCALGRRAAVSEAFRVDDVGLSHWEFGFKVRSAHPTSAATMQSLNPDHEPCYYRNLLKVARITEKVHWQRRHYPRPDLVCSPTCIFSQI